MVRNFAKFAVNFAADFEQAKDRKKSHIRNDVFEEARQQAAP